MTADAPLILIVDDDAGIRGMVELALTERGYRVATSDGSGTLEVDDVDLILLDVRLRARSALDLDFGDDAPPIVVMTAGDHGRRVAEQLHAVDRIAKPFDLVHLFDAVDRALAGGARRAG
ncbi:MAG TPA: response regulator [Candidatus Limnocylindrales bacterium]